MKELSHETKEAAYKKFVELIGHRPVDNIQFKCALSYAHTMLNTWRETSSLQTVSLMSEWYFEGEYRLLEGEGLTWEALMRRVCDRSPGAVWVMMLRMKHLQEGL